MNLIDEFELTNEYIHVKANENEGIQYKTEQFISVKFRIRYLHTLLSSFLDRLISSLLCFISFVNHLILVLSIDLCVCACVSNVYN